MKIDIEKITLNDFFEIYLLSTNSIINENKDINEFKNKCFYGLIDKTKCLFYKNLDLEFIITDDVDLILRNAFNRIPIFNINLILNILKKYEIQ